MELILAILIALATAAVVSLPYFVGLAHTPAGMTFLGTVHHPEDYHYYLSFLAQGADRWLLGVNLHSGELIHLTLVNWIYVVLGRLFYLLHISPIVGYQLAVAAGVVFFLWMAYLFIARVVKPTSARIIGLLLFVTSNAFPILTPNQSGWHLSYYTSWFNYGHPFTRLSSVPHHLFVQGAILLALYCAASWYRQQQSKLSFRAPQSLALMVLGCLGFFLGSLQPVQWLVTTGVVGVSGLIMSLYAGDAREGSRGEVPFGVRTVLMKTKRFISRTNGNEPRETRAAGPAQRTQFLHHNVPTLILFSSGLAPVLYLKHLFTTQPYLQTALWEAGQHVHIPPIDFLLNNGPVMLLGLGGFLLWFHKKNLLLGMGIFYTLLVTAVFFSPLPQQLRILNIRFLSSVPTLVYAIAATQLLDDIAGFFARYRPWALGIMVGMLLLVLVPVDWLQLQERFIYDTNNTFLYIRNDAKDALDKLRTLTSPDQTNLVLWPYTEVTPALTGRRVYYSNFLATTDADTKGTLQYEFFDGKMDEPAMGQLVKANNIAYVVSYPWSFTKKNLPFLERIYENAALTIYKVN